MQCVPLGGGVAGDGAEPAERSPQRIALTASLPRESGPQATASHRSHAGTLRSTNSTHRERSGDHGVTAFRIFPRGDRCAVVVINHQPQRHHRHHGVTHRLVAGKRQLVRVLRINRISSMSTWHGDHDPLVRAATKRALPEIELGASLRRLRSVPSHPAVCRPLMIRVQSTA